MRIFRNENIVTGVAVICILLAPVLVNAGTDSAASLPDIADRWAQNAMELGQATKSLSAANALLKEENKHFEDSIKILDQENQGLSQEVRTLFLQEKQLAIMQDEKKKNLFSLLRKTAKVSEEALAFQKEQEILSAQVASVVKQQADAHDKIVKVSQEIKSLEQKSFAQQRRDDELANYFKGTRGAVLQFLDDGEQFQKELRRALEGFNDVLVRSYERIADVGVERRNLELALVQAQEEGFLLEAQQKELSGQRAGLKLQLQRKPKDIASLRVIVNAEKKEICDDRVTQKKEILSSRKSMRSPRIESLTVILKERCEENKFLKKEIARLTQALHRLEKQKINIQNILTKE